MILKCSIYPKRDFFAQALDKRLLTYSNQQFRIVITDALDTLISGA